MEKRVVHYNDIYAAADSLSASDEAMIMGITNALRSSKTVFQDKSTFDQARQKDLFQLKLEAFEQKGRNRFSHVLEGEPQNLLPVKEGMAFRESHPEYSITIAPRLHFTSRAVEGAHSDQENLRFNVGGPPAWEKRLVRGDRPTRERQLLHRVLVSMSTLEVQSRNLTKFPSTTLTDKDKHSKYSKFGLQNIPYPPRKHMERGSVVNSLQGLSANLFSGNFPDESNIPVVDSAGDFDLTYMPVKTSANAISKFRSTVITSAHEEAKQKPSLNILEGNIGKYTSHEIMGHSELGAAAIEDFDAANRLLFNQHGRLPVTQSNPNFGSDEIVIRSESDWPISAGGTKAVNFEKLVSECKRLDRGSFEQAEEFIIHHEETLSWIIKTGHELSILKDLMDCSRPGLTHR